MFFLSKTQIYTVHINTSKPNSIENAVFIREGFNLFAFIFGIFWALYYRMWLLAFGFAVVAGLFGAAERMQWLDKPSLVILQGAFSLSLGLYGNDLRRWFLSRCGYIMADVVVSDNELRAQQRYFDRVFA